MAFLALTNAPGLDSGVVLNIMAVPQTVGVTPSSIESGARMTIRFGHCCPDIADAEIVDLTTERAVIALGSMEWILEPMGVGTGVTVPGIISENWVVCGERQCDAGVDTSNAPTAPNGYRLKRQRQQVQPQLPAFCE